MREHIIILCLVVTILILYGLQIQATNELGVINVHYFDVMKRVDRLEKDNAALRQALLNEQSYRSLLSKATKMGFEEARYLVLK